MYRGTTPTLKFNLPFELEESDVIFITLAQFGETRVEKTNAEITLSGNTAEVVLTQEETLRLKAGPVDIQIRVRLADGTALASKVVRASANAILKDGVI